MFSSTLVNSLIREEHALVDAVNHRIARVADGQDRVGAPKLRDFDDCARTAVAGLIARLSVGDGGHIRLEPFAAHARAHRIAGGSLRDLLSVYRLGGLAMLEHARTMPVARSLDSATFLRLAEEVFSLVEELSAAAADSFTALDDASASPDDARRARLHALLLSDPPARLETLADAAQAAGWPLPRRIRVAIATRSVGPAASTPPSRVIWGAVNERCILVVADDDESERWLKRAADSLGLERPLVIGPAASVERGRRSATHAIALSDVLASDPSNGASDVIRCDERQVDLLLAVDRELSQSFSARLLAPVAGLPTAQRDRMLDTLDAWLANPGRPQAMAGQLHLHVQGVRYRLARLRDLFGDALDDPRERFELALALRAHRLLGSGINQPA